MSEHSKIPLPPFGEDALHRDSLIERAAARFDFNSLIAPPPLALSPRRQPARPKPAGPGKTTAIAAEIIPDVGSHPVRVEHGRDTFAPDSRVSTSLGTNEVGNEPAFEAPVPEAEPTLAEAAADFSQARHAIDREHLRENGLIVPEGSVTALLEEFRIVKRQLLVQSAELRRQKAGSRAQRVLISSPHPGEGKTYCAVNLALSIAAEKESDVLLVDADFAKPSILSALGLPGGPGLMDALMDESADVADFVLATDIPGLWVLPAGDTTTNDSEYLSSSRTEKVLERLTHNAPNRMMILDSPPALAASPAAELAKYVGQAVVIVRADRTGQGALEDAVSLLSSCPNIQLLLNASQFSPSGRSFGTYYGYKE